MPITEKDALILTRQVAHVEDTAEAVYMSRFGPATYRQPATGQLLPQVRVSRHDKGLSKVERAFRCMKSVT